MGMSTHVVGIKPPDDHWKRMKAVWDACEAAKVPPPDDVDDFFDGEKPDPQGVIIDLTFYANLEPHPSLKKWEDEYREGYEVRIKDLPKDVTIVRFYNSW